jgi:hypothetical protein
VLISSYPSQCFESNLPVIEFLFLNPLHGAVICARQCVWKSLKLPSYVPHGEARSTGEGLNMKPSKQEHVLGGFDSRMLNVRP